MYNDGMSLTALTHPVLPDGRDVGSFTVSPRVELTLREAADVLGVPEVDLIALLNDGEIES
jgi:hypothetical protein